MLISRRVGSLEGSATLSITSEVGRLVKEGREVHSFTAGQLDFPTPDYIKKAAIEAIENNFTKYTPVAGIPELCAEIASWTEERYGISYDPASVIVSTGAKQSLFNSLHAVLEEGMSCIIFSPYWVSYPEMIKSTGAEPIIVEASAEKGFVPELSDFEAAIRKDTKAVIINSPQNPTGAVYPKEFFEGAAKIAREHDLIVISDEIYSEILTEGVAHHSIASFPGMKERTVLVNGVSKTFSMTGWRIGWALGPKEIMNASKRLQSHATSNACSISQKASLAALQRKEAIAFIEKVRSSIEKRRDLALSILGECDRVKAIKPKGAFYIMIDVHQLLGGNFKNSADLCKNLLAEHGIAFIPGDVFGKPGFIRMSIATGEATIEKGLRKFVKIAEGF